MGPASALRPRSAPWQWIARKGWNVGK
jgi:hypothetical protein